MKKYIIISVLMLGTAYASAQTSVLDVIAPAGSYFWNSSAGISLSWTLGEPVTATFVNTGAGIILTQGFQQGNMLGTAVPENPLSGFSAQMYPNPAQVETRIKVILPSLTRVYVQVMDITGRTIILESFEPASVEHTHILNVSNLRAGVYLVKLNAGSKQQRIFKLLKE